MTRLGWVLTGVALVVGLVILMPLFRGGSPGGGGPAGMAGQVAPVYDMRSDLGAETSLAKYRGRVVVMNLWASWCPPCREEMPDLQRLQDTYDRAGLVVVGVDQGEAAERAAAFARSLRITYPIWVDGDQRYGRVYAALGLPTTVVIDQNGVVARGFDGPLTFDQMRAAVLPLLKAHS
jgi:thiol-disulfide isomerase/thioredoxin